MAEPTPELTPAEQALHDRIDLREDQMDAAAEAINDLFELLDLDALLADPHGYMAGWLELVAKVMVERVLPAAEQAGHDAAVRVGEAALG